MDVRYGTRVARKFIDSRELEGDARSLMNLHNNQAGRKVCKKLFFYDLQISFFLSSYDVLEHKDILSFLDGNKVSFVYYH